MKAIETVYDGYRFRSRLEARWAVFFNALNIEFEYEKEGFETPFGRYLPDFWFPKIKTWVEVKGKEPEDNEIEALTWVCYNTKTNGYFLHGLPGQKKNYFPMFIRNTKGKIHYELNCDWFWDNEKESFVLNHIRHGQDVVDFGIDTAKQARFEHGEMPEVNF